MSLVVDDLVDWLVGLVADTALKKLTTWVLGSEQERALRQAARAAVTGTIRELRPSGGTSAEELGMVISEVFAEPAPDPLYRLRATLLEAVQAGVAAQLAILDDVSITGTGQSSSDVLGIPAGIIAETLTGHLIREILARGSRGGPLEPLAAQMNHDMTHLQNQRLAEMVQQIAKLAPAAAVELTVRYSLPPDTVAFTGRERELDRIIATVTESIDKNSAIAIHAIDGMPGVGKTTLAVHAAHLLRQRFPDRQLFVDLHAHTPGRDPVTPEAALAELLTAFGVDARYLPADLGGRVALWRDRTTGQRTLLVLDNAASSEQVIPLLPGGDGCVVLVTSRRHLGDLPTAVPLPLVTMPPDEAMVMFRRLAPRDTSADETVAELLRLTGNLPLAISLLARVYARHPAWSLTDLIAETEASMLTMSAERDSIAAAFDVSYRNLSTNQQRFFRRLGLHPGTTTDTYAAAAVAGVSHDAATDHLDSLHGEGLLTEIGRRRYGMHNLLRRYAHDKAVADPVIERNQALERLLDYYQRAAAISEARLTRQTKARSVLPMVAPADATPDLHDSTSALAWARTERDNLLSCIDYATANGQHVAAIAITAAIATLLRHDGPWADAATRHQAAIDAARYLGDHNSAAVALNEFGVIQRLMGDYPAASQALTEALAIYRRLGDQLGEANVLSNLGPVKGQTGGYPVASQALTEALAIYRRLGDQLGEANVLSNLGAVRRMIGDYPRSIEAQEKALAMYRQLGDHLGEANALTNLGVVLALTGQYPSSVEAHRTALVIYRHSGDGLGQAAALSNLASVLKRTKDYSAAVEMLEAALGIVRRTGDRFGEAHSLGTLAMSVG